MSGQGQQDEADDQGRDERDPDEVDAARKGRDSGGDAPAAASMEVREAVARGDDDLFEGDDDG